MQKKYTSLGLMSGTSGDGVDASIINSNGIDQFEVIKDKYFEYDSKIYSTIHYLKEKIFNLKDLKKLSKELLELEKKITFFHAKVVKEFEFINEDILVGFHGQTIYHNGIEKISRQLGDGKLLHQLTKKKIIFDFRKNDIANGGEGAPLAPIYHQLIATQNNILLPVCFLNIGGISNITIVSNSVGSTEIFSKDLGPGNCLIDTWVRKNSNKKFDMNGDMALSGKKNEIIFEQAKQLYDNRINKKKLTFDTNDFDVSFARGLSLEDGVATITDLTASIISAEISTSVLKLKKNLKNILVCGGGRKNKVLLNKIKEYLPTEVNLILIDDHKINGDFVESQAFAFLAIRSLLKLPISFPETTGCLRPSTGGEIVEN
jgi:anhydro-N-acetylmuramic acid kinase